MKSGSCNLVIGFDWSIIVPYIPYTNRSPTILNMRYFGKSSQLPKKIRAAKKAQKMELAKKLVAKLKGRGPV